MFAPVCAKAIAAASPAGPPPTTTASYMADASFMAEQSAFPAVFSSPHRIPEFTMICAAERRKRGCANRNDS
jgi:hypothetical protein